MVKLQRLFRVQDEVFEEHLSQSPLLKQVFDFISDCLWLDTKILVSLSFDSEKQTVIRRFAVDSLSHSIVAVRTGLWGDLPESLTILRSALESALQLQYIVREQKYATTVYEMDRKLNQVSFGSAISGLGALGDRAKTIHGRLSEDAADATAKRMNLVAYEHDGEVYDRVGFARNKEWAEMALFYCMDTSVMVAQALHEAMAQEGLPIPWEDELAALHQRFETLRNNCLDTRKSTIRAGDA